MITILLNVLIAFAIFLLVMFAVVIVFAFVKTIKTEKEANKIINKTFNIDSSNPNDLANMIRKKIDEDL